MRQVCDEGAEEIKSGLRIGTMHVDQNDMPIEKETTEVKHSKAAVRGKARPALDIRFEAQHLTSYSGLILFQHFFCLIGIKERLWGCFRHLQGSPIYSHHVIMMLLVVHLIIGHRRLRDVEYYRDDEMVKRVLGLKRLPDVSTISRALGSADAISVEKLRGESRALVLERLSAEGLARVTLDFDGSVLSTGRHAEGTAVGFNKKKKGARSYYPLFCTVSQTDQVLDVHHRPGNVHDSNGADAFIDECLQRVRAALPRVKIETRIDSAFFNETIAEGLDGTGVGFTISVPFERFTELKGMIEGRRRWRRLNGMLSYFETHWKPKSWSAPYRFIFIRKQVRCQDKAPVQLDLFRPTEYGYDFKVIVTNKRASPRKVVAFHEGRGSQEGIFAELKSHCQMDYVPVTTRAGNQLYMFAGILAHNLTRELQMQVTPRTRATTAKRATLWCFREIATLRRTLIQRAGRIIRPAGKLILSMNSNETLENDLLHCLGRLKALGA
jgi:hypothetical protein